MSETTTRRLLRWSEVEARVGISRSTGWRWIQQGAFPSPVKIGPNRHSARWSLDSIEMWLDEQGAGGDAPGGSGDAEAEAS